MTRTNPRNKQTDSEPKPSLLVEKSEGNRRVTRGAKLVKNEEAIPKSSSEDKVAIINAQQRQQQQDVLALLSTDIFSEEPSSILLSNTSNHDLLQNPLLSTTVRYNSTIMDILLDSRSGKSTHKKSKKRRLHRLTPEQRQRRKERKIRNAEALKSKRECEKNLFTLRQSYEQAERRDNPQFFKQHNIPLPVDIDGFDETIYITQSENAKKFLALRNAVMRNYNAISIEPNTPDEYSGDSEELDDDDSSVSNNIASNTSNVILDSSKNSHDTSVQGPQFSVVDGKLVLNEDSLYVGHHEEDNMPSQYVDEDYRSQDYRKFMGRKPTATKWSMDEVRLLYKLLGEHGVDFQFISKYFPTKTRRQIKARYKKEERERPRMISLALKNSLQIDETAFAEAVTEYRKYNPQDVIHTDPMFSMVNTQVNDAGIASTDVHHLEAPLLDIPSNIDIKAFQSSLKSELKQEGGTFSDSNDDLELLTSGFDRRTFDDYAPIKRERKK